MGCLNVILYIENRIYGPRKRQKIFKSKKIKYKTLYFKHFF